MGHPHAGAQKEPHHRAFLFRHAPEGGDCRNLDLRTVACDTLAATHERERVPRRIEDHRIQLIEINGEKERGSFWN